MSVPKIESYEDFLPYLYHNEVVVVRGVSENEKWHLKASSVLSNEALREVEVPVDEVGKERRIMKFGEFYEMARTKTLYVKDWHLDQIDSLSSLYSVPLPFQDDWLNWYWQELFPQFREAAGCPEDDYSFC